MTPHDFPSVVKSASEEVGKASLVLTGVNMANYAEDALTQRFSPIFNELTQECNKLICETQEIGVQNVDLRRSLASLTKERDELDEQREFLQAELDHAKDLRDELAASNQELRKAMVYATIGSLCICAPPSPQEPNHKCFFCRIREALSSTPAASMAEHDASVLEGAAKEILHLITNASHERVVIANSLIRMASSLHEKKGEVRG